LRFAPVRWQGHRAFVSGFFFANHRLIASFPYRDDVDYGSTDIPLEQFEGSASGVEGRFFTMDVARRVDGS
jgi:hypothetical protein